MRFFAVVFVFQVIFNCFYFLTPKQSAKAAEVEKIQLSAATPSIRLQILSHLHRFKKTKKLLEQNRGGVLCFFYIRNKIIYGKLLNIFSLKFI